MSVKTVKQITAEVNRIGSVKSASSKVEKLKRDLKSAQATLKRISKSERSKITRTNDKYKAVAKKKSDAKRKRDQIQKTEKKLRELRR